MKIHKINIHSILFGNGKTKKQEQDRNRKLRKKNELPGLKDLIKNRKKVNKKKSKLSLSWLFRK